MERRYIDVISERDAVGLRHERRDCTVVALALVTGQSYVAAHEVLASRYGRKDGHGLAFSGLFVHPTDSSPVSHFGFSWEPVPLSDLMLANGGHRPTTCKIHKFLHPQGRFLIFVRRHVLAAVNGRVRDWSMDNRLRPQRVIQVYESSGKPVSSLCTASRMRASLRLATKGVRSLDTVRPPMREGNCSRVWDICDELSRDFYLEGLDPAEEFRGLLVEVLDAAYHRGIPENTAKTQFYRWKKWTFS